MKNPDPAGRTVIPNLVAPGNSPHDAAGRVAVDAQHNLVRNYWYPPRGLGSSYNPSLKVSDKMMEIKRNRYSFM